MPYPCIQSSGDRNDNEVGELSSGHQGPNPNSPGLLPLLAVTLVINKTLTSLQQTRLGLVAWWLFVSVTIMLKDTFYMLYKTNKIHIEVQIFSL